MQYFLLPTLFFTATQRAIQNNQKLPWILLDHEELTSVYKLATKLNLSTTHLTKRRPYLKITPEAFKINSLLVGHLVSHDTSRTYSLKINHVMLFLGLIEPLPQISQNPLPQTLSSSFLSWPEKLPVNLIWLILV